MKFRQYTSLLRTYIEIHSMGIAHRDPGIRNMLLYPSWDGDFKVVVIDFTISSFITLAEKANLTWSDTESLLMHQCLIDELDEKSFRQWKASKRGKLVWEAFQRGPGKYFEPDFEDSSYGKSPRLQLHSKSCQTHA